MRHLAHTRHNVFDAFLIHHIAQILFDAGSLRHIALALRQEGNQHGVNRINVAAHILHIVAVFNRKRRFTHGAYCKRAERAKNLAQFGRF